MLMYKTMNQIVAIPHSTAQCLSFILLDPSTIKSSSTSDIIMSFNNMPGIMSNRTQYEQSSEHDKISTKVLTKLAEDVAPHLTSIFTTSLETSRIPHQWETILVAPIFKNWDRNNAANYRPVSLTSICCKVCEYIIAKSIMQTPGRPWLVNQLETWLQDKVHLRVVVKRKQY